MSDKLLYRLILAFCTSLHIDLERAICVTYTALSMPLVSKLVEHVCMPYVVDSCSRIIVARTTIFA
jgi:hypothetical protein